MTETNRGNRPSSLPVDLDHFEPRDLSSTSPPNRGRPPAGTSRIKRDKTPENRTPGGGAATGEIAPLSKPKVELDQIISILSDSKSHWESMIESLVNLRALATFHQEVKKEHF